MSGGAPWGRGDWPGLTEIVRTFALPLHVQGRVSPHSQALTPPAESLQLPGPHPAACSNPSLLTLLPPTHANPPPGGDLPPGLMDEVKAAVKEVEDAMGKKFGAKDNTLLFSVRSGAAVRGAGLGPCLCERH